MKKLLYQFDTDALPSVFDNVVAYDGGADHVAAYAGVTAANVGALVDGAIYTRGMQNKKNTALFIGGSNLAAGEAVLAAVRRRFFGKFRVSVMFDCNGANTTAAAAVARLSHRRSLSGKHAVVLAGTGPIGQRAAVLLAREGAAVSLTGRKQEGANAAAEAIKTTFGIQVRALAAASNAERAAALAGAHIVVAAGASGVTLLDESQWRDHPTLELLADANVAPPAGLGGIEPADRGAQRAGKTVFGALGFGALKLALHRACIARLFEQNDLLLDVDDIYALAKQMTESGS